jgi:hypothetical protein
VKLFQIEEPDGSPSDPEAPGAAIGIDLTGTLAVVAVAVGGNAAVLADREGFERDLPVPGPDGNWPALFEGSRLRAERSLGRPVTHAVVALAEMPDSVFAMSLTEAAMAAGMELLTAIAASRLAHGENPAEAAAVLAEDLAPRPEAI